MVKRYYAKCFRCDWYVDADDLAHARELSDAHDVEVGHNKKKASIFGWEKRAGVPRVSL